MGNPSRPKPLGPALQTERRGPCYHQDVSPDAPHPPHTPAAFGARIPWQLLFQRSTAALQLLNPFKLIFPRVTKGLSKPGTHGSIF